MLVYTKNHHGFQRNPVMKIMGKTADFSSTKEKREENEGMISMWKKANAFFSPGSFFPLSSPFFLTIFTTVLNKYGNSGRCCRCIV